ncbi:hypothetical protein NP233_g4462 [Leucocoprinus birnbaumii]|uniref:Uncharacterized protein n=1 Tax=Leucocoprinus birnbaumii TaxID=56174 RepID=A0AAD5VUN4_9AGAR|nr:hypothetical protein NP233_g4462 [Leucocoprinus birnbaumii]
MIPTSVESEIRRHSQTRANRTRPGRAVPGFGDTVSRGHDLANAAHHPLCRTSLFLSYRESRTTSTRFSRRRTSRYTDADTGDDDEEDRLIGTSSHVALDVDLPPKWYAGRTESDAGADTWAG